MNAQTSTLRPTPHSETGDVILELRNIVKRFPGIVANDHVSLKIRAGEVHALLGENGAGKSTLMKVVYGLYQKDEGEVLVRNQPAHIRVPQDAMALGIGMVHQHFMLVPNFTVIENIILGLRTDRYPLLDLGKSLERIKTLADDFGLNAPLSAKVGGLTVGQQQKVEIIKALYRGARILILDEPTAVLIPQEAEELFKLIEHLRADGVTLIFISHKLKEVLRVSDRITVMRRGQLIDTRDTTATTIVELAELMVGKAVDLSVAKRPSTPGENHLELRRVTTRADQGVRPLQELDLALRSGEIHGLAGVDGNGQQALVQAIMGLCPVAGGQVIFHGRDIRAMETAERISRGIEHIPENRHTEGLVLGLSVTDNLLLERFEHRPFGDRGLRQFKIMRAHAATLMQKFDIRAPNPDIQTLKLSGGNQQKVILARSLWPDPTVLIAMQPTRGLDVGAASFIQ
ncbi:MAG: ABC transporter ATP-binding protein [Anaerolineales bacterium]|nr:ABC transporter ATP-binding protein [Anaerolineales bacterium]